MDYIPYIAKAIKRAENDPTGRFGVRSVDVKSSAEANQVLLNSIVNNIAKWKKAGKPGRFVDFMHTKGGPWGKGWAPIGAENDPENLNANWGRNVKAILKETMPEVDYTQWDKFNTEGISSADESVSEGEMETTETFSESFRKARKAGLKDFKWRGSRYTTKLKGE